MPEEYGDLKLRVPDEEDEATGADVPLSLRDLTDSLGDRLAGGGLALDGTGDVLVKPTRGIVAASGNLNVLGSTAFADVPGTEKKLVLARASIIVVRAVFAFKANDNHANFGSGDFRGIASIDGSTPGGATANEIAYFRTDLSDESQIIIAQGHCIFEKEVAAGERVLKLRAHGAAGTEWDQQEVQAVGTFYEYEVWAA